MVAVKAGDVEGALRRRLPGTWLLLIYGPDAGLVAERARLAAEGAVADPADPFQLIRLEGDAVAADPGRLSDEATTLGLFGERRAIWVKPTTRNLVPAAEILLRAPVQDTLVVIEAGDLARSSPLRSLCERAPAALALPCYADNERDLARVVDETLREAGLAADRDVRDLLARSLGGDRLATRGELDKLVLFARGRDSVTIEDVEAVVSDVSSAALDGVLDAAFGGQPAAVIDGARRLAREGVTASTMLTFALRHALALAAARAEVEAGRSAPSAVESWRGLSFKRRSAVERQLARWTSAALRRTIAVLQDAVLDSRRLSELGEVLAMRVLLDLAGEGSRRRAS